MSADFPGVQTNVLMPGINIMVAFTTALTTPFTNISVYTVTFCQAVIAINIYSLVILLALVIEITVTSPVNTSKHAISS
jgi:hypothetical protein